MIRVRDKNAGALLIGETDVSCVFYQGEVVWKKNSTQYVFTESGSIAIPSYAVFLDLVLIGGGASGMTGSGASGIAGAGGAAGQWLGVTLERGVNLPWSTKNAVITVGAGAPFADDSDFASSIPGSPSAVSLTGVSSIVALGGSGRRSENVKEGQSAGSYPWENQLYVGGAGGITSGSVAEETGKAPGGGGAGGAGGYFGSRARGRPGGRGQVWVKFRSY